MCDLNNCTNSVSLEGNFHRFLDQKDFNAWCIPKRLEMTVNTGATSADETLLYNECVEQRPKLHRCKILSETSKNYCI